MLEGEFDENDGDPHLKFTKYVCTHHRSLFVLEYLQTIMLLCPCIKSQL